MKIDDNQQLETLMVSEIELSNVFNTTDLDAVLLSIKTEAAPILSRIRQFPNFPSHDALGLIMLFLFKGKFLHKNYIARVGSQFLKEKQTDWQIRHISTQEGFFILNRGDFIPETHLKCPSGWHMLINLTDISPRYLATKRANLLKTKDFEIIKLSFKNCCATCGSEEGEINRMGGATTVLQKGHCDPNNPLEIGNIIPQCDYCNQTYLDDYYFLPNGSIDKPNYQSDRVINSHLTNMIRAKGKNDIQKFIDLIIID